MDKYRLVQVQRQQQPANEMRVKAEGRVQAYVQYAAKLFLENKETSIKIKATGNAIPKAIILSEILKRRISNLHQLNSISSLESTQTYEPLEEGLDSVTFTRRLTCFEIQLSTVELDSQNSGYQPPIDQSEVRELTISQLSQNVGGFPRGRRASNYQSRGSRRSRGNFQARRFGGSRRVDGGFGGRRSSYPRNSRRSRGGPYTEGQFQRGQYQEGQVQRGQYQEGQAQRGQYQEGHAQRGQFQDQRRSFNKTGERGQRRSFNRSGGQFRGNNRGYGGYQNNQQRQQNWEGQQDGKQWNQENQQQDWKGEKEGAAWS